MHNEALTNGVRGELSEITLLREAVESIKRFIDKTKHNIIDDSYSKFP